MERAYSFFFLASLVVHFVKTSSSAAAVNSIANNNTRDLDALLAFKSTIFDPQNILPTNWSTSTSICNWIGITCNSRHQRIAAIDLPKMGLMGTIPPQLGNLSFLVRLNVENNSFHGNLPAELAHLRRLKYINLAGNDFDGIFPPWLGALSKLQFLTFLDNKFSGSLSGLISNTTKLEVFGVGYNFLTGNIPEGYFNDLNNLKILDLQFNQLRGPLPKALFNISSLERFSFTNNSLSGYLPVSICNHLPHLQGLHLSFNGFHGQIPSGIGKCTKLEILSLSYNKLSGTIPKDVWNMTTLRLLALGRNNLQGEIPQDIGNLQNLERVGIDKAGITGIIPQEIGNLHKLELIKLSSNSLTGTIPSQFFNISVLRIADFGGNQLSGVLPSTLGVMLPNLEELYLGGNGLSGAILTSITNASKLNFLDLNFNRFIGAIPHTLGNLRLLKHLSLVGNNFSYESPTGELSFLTSLTNCRRLGTLLIAGNPLNGFLPTSIGNFSSSLEWIDISYSGINGEIPSSIGNWSNLEILYLASNKFKGIIPPTIGGLLKLQRVRFEGNNIEGSIPTEICYLLNLGQLSLRSNRLSGMVPSCIGNITFLRYLFLNSNNLTSNIPSSFWSLRGMLTLDLSTNSLTGSIPLEVGNLKGLVAVNLSMNQFFGEVPSTIGALQDLQELSFAHNKLQGSIPASMKNMLSLRYLDLSFNNLAGVIPNSLELLSNLQYFNVSYNKLWGQIPRGGPFMKFTNLSFLSNEALCGAPWLQPCPTFENRSREKRIVLFVLLGAGFAILALITSTLLMRKLRRKVKAPTHDLLPLPAYERVSLHELRQITHGFSDSMLLGSGTFGSVYKGIRENGMIWAIKVFNLQLEGAFKSFDIECEVLRRLRHRNLTKVISACSNPDFKALVLEYMPNESLEKWLYLNDQFLNIMQRLDIMIDVACGLEYLHYDYSVPVVHCDLKPSNILLDEDMVGHISDFGIAKLLGDGESMVQTMTLATFGYIAPEYGLEGLVSTKCDVYSFGIILMETFTKRRPKDEIFTEELTIRHWIQESFPHSIAHVIDVNLLEPDDEQATEKIRCVSSIMQLALNCTANAPEERINIKDVLLALKKIKFQLLPKNK